MIRAAILDDIDAIARIEAISTPHAWDATSLARTLTTPGVVAFVAETERVVGHVLALATADFGEVLLIAVDPTARRGGLGRNLLARACEAWCAAGATEAWLEVRADNTAAIKLYDSFGFVEAGRRRAYYRDGTDAVRMRWSASRATEAGTRPFS